MITSSDIKTPVQAYLIDRPCFRCDDNGVMRPTGTVFTVNPPLIEHKCNKCGYTMGYRETFPYLHYETQES